jgi:hypothetical protein
VNCCDEIVNCVETCDETAAYCELWHALEASHLEAAQNRHIIKKLNKFTWPLNSSFNEQTNMPCGTDAVATPPTSKFISDVKPT